MNDHHAMDLKTNLFAAYDRHLSLSAASPPGHGGSTRQNDAPSDAPEDERASIARHLGMDKEEDKHLMWIAELALTAPLPEDWNSYETPNGELYYHKPETGETSWDHPNDIYFRTLYQKTKEHENASLKMAEAASLLFRSSVGEHGVAQRDLSPRERSDYVPDYGIQQDFQQISPVLRAPHNDRNDSILSESELRGNFSEEEESQANLAGVLQCVEEQRVRLGELETSIQSIHEAVQSLREDHYNLKTDGLGGVQRVTQKLQTMARDIITQMRNIEGKQNCDSMFKRLSSHPDTSLRSMCLLKSSCLVSPLVIDQSNGAACNCLFIYRHGGTFLAASVFARR